MERKINVNIRFTEITIRPRLRIRVYCISADHSVEFTNRCIRKWCSCGIIADVREKETFSALRCVIYRPRTLEHRRVGYTPFFSSVQHIYLDLLASFEYIRFAEWLISLLSRNKMINSFIDDGYSIKNKLKIRKIRI